MKILKIFKILEVQNVDSSGIRGLYLMRLEKKHKKECYAKRLARRRQTMHTRIHRTLTIAVAFSLLIYLVTVFGCSRGDGPSLEDIPRYPNATEVESMEQSSFGGIVSGSLVQFTTTDTYDEVLDSAGMEA